MYRLTKRANCSPSTCKDVQISTLNFENLHTRGGARASTSLVFTCPPLTLLLVKRVTVCVIVCVCGAARQPPVIDDECSVLVPSARESANGGEFIYRPGFGVSISCDVSGSPVTRYAGMRTTADDAGHTEYSTHPLTPIVLTIDSPENINFPAELLSAARPGRWPV